MSYFYEITFNLPLNQNFIYQSSQDNLVNRRVLVAWRKQLKVGFVVKKSVPFSPQTFTIKKIHSVIDENKLPINSDQIKLAKWISYFYFCSLGEALALFFSFKKVKEDKDKDEIKPTLLNKFSFPQINLTSEQNTVFSEIKDNLNSFNYYLIFGVTGSGKTFLYLKFITEVIKKKKQVIVFQPEIVLAIQTYEILIRFFPSSIVCLYHGKLSDSQKKKIKKKLQKNSTMIVVGTRSSFFMSFSCLGLVVLDEENDNSYKNNQTPRYQLRTLVHYYCRKKKIPLLSFSATPTIENLYLAKINKIKLFYLRQRYNCKPLPKITYIQTWESQKISHMVYKAIFNKLEKKEQVVIYINKRGFSSSILCKDCQEISKCRSCNVSLTYYHKKGEMICHYCHFSIKFLKVCINCGSPNLVAHKLGIEKIFEDLKEKFRGFRIERFDSDNLSSTKKINEIIHDFNHNHVPILVGTQMLIKGHDFNNVGLVVIFHPEKYLILPDYKSNERVVAHILQAAGRAGRKKKQGEVIIQTEIPQSYPLGILSTSDYEKFYKNEIEIRKKYFYPPFSRLVRFIFRGKNNQEIESIVNQKFVSLKRTFKNQRIFFLNPCPCLINKIKSNYRWNIIIKVFNLKNFLKILHKNEDWLKIKKKNIYLEVDIDPVDLF